MLRSAPTRLSWIVWLALLVGWLWPRPLHAQVEARGSAREQTAGVGQRYELTARLDPVRHEVRGTARIQFTNHSTRALPSLIFHLYLNAFRDDDSVFMRESGGFMRGHSLQGSGSIALQELRVGGRDLLPTARRELVRGDFTQLEVPLERPLAPGESVVIESSFLSKLPPAFARSGHAGDFHCVAQWFPKLAKLEPSGEFASFPYHALGEFYADFADYELRVDTPAAFVVAANGKLFRETKERGRVVRSFSMSRVHDAVWVASPALLVRKERVAQVDVQYFYPPGYELALAEHAEIVRSGLAHFGRQFGPYPHPTLSVVVPPRGAEGVAGMEYPGLFLTDGSWLAVPRSPGLSGAFVTAHELAHQWFPGMLASNEVRWPVLDEGFAEWAAIDLLRARFGEWGALSAYLPFSRFEVERIGAFARGASTAPGLAAYAFTNAEYGSSVYARGASALETVRRVYGRARFEQALRRYADEERFKHPTPERLGAAFDAVYGAGFAERVLLPLLIEGKLSSVRIVQASTSNEAAIHVTEVRARRDGEVPLPTWLAAFDAQGKQLTRVAWPAENGTLHARIETRTPVARVAVDPDRALLLDPDVRDQIHEFTRPNRRSWLNQLIAVCQLLLSWVGP